MQIFRQLRKIQAGISVQRHESTLGAGIRIFDRTFFIPVRYQFQEKIGMGATAPYRDQGQGDRM
jgi:hypothetical protein